MRLMAYPAMRVFDISCVVGTPVRAAHDGTVYGHYAASSYGLYLEVIDTTRRTIYAHLSSTSLTDGTEVRAGDIIGHSGNTGNSTGAHLHFGLYDIPRSYNNGYRGAVDPLPYLLAWEARMEASLQQAQGNRYRIEEVVRRIQRAEALEREALALREEARQELAALVEHNGPLYHLEALLGGPVPDGYRDGGQGA